MPDPGISQHTGIRPGLFIDPTVKARLQAVFRRESRFFYPVYTGCVVYGGDFSWKLFLHRYLLSY